MIPCQVSTWRQIPFQEADLDLENLTMEAALRPDGSLRGEVKLEARGRGAEFVRKAARNPDVLKRLLTRLTVQEAMPNAAISEFKATEVESVFKPARVAWSFGADNVAVRDGQTVRMKIPIRWKPMSGFELQGVSIPFYWVSNERSSSGLILPCLRAQRCSGNPRMRASPRSAWPLSEKSRWMTICCGYGRKSCRVVSAYLWKITARTAIGWLRLPGPLAKSSCSACHVRWSQASKYHGLDVRGGLREAIAQRLVSGHMWHAAPPDSNECRCSLV